MHLFALCIITIAITLCFAQNQTQSQDFISLQGQILSEQAKQNEERQEQIPNFIIEEIKQTKIHQATFKEEESFLVSLASDANFQFKYKIKSNLNPSMVIHIYTQENEDDIVSIKDHSTDCYLEIYSSTNLLETQILVGKTYLHKFIQLDAQIAKDLFIRIVNKFGKQVIVEISLSGPPLRIDHQNILKNSQFQLMAKKLAGIQNEMTMQKEANRKKFKFQWGFLGREQHYEQQMLKLTGVEAFIILTTAIVQIYCIKSLIEQQVTII